MAQLPWQRSVSVRETVGLTIVVIAAAAALFINLQLCELGNSYYAAGVKSMLQNPSNWFFAAYDPAGFVSIDKPPLGFWLQTASVWAFGFSGFSLFLPQLLAALFGVVMLFFWLRPRLGLMPSLVGAAVLALTPIVVATARNNTIDALLVPVFIGIGWAVVRSIEKRQARYLYLAFALLGIGFNIKMMEVMLIAPAMAVTYFWGGWGSLLRRIGHFVGAGALFLVLALSWATAVDLAPTDQRPYVGSTQHNSEYELIMGHNGLDRLGVNRPRPEGRRENSEPANAANQPAAQNLRQELFQLGFNTSRPGPLRFFENDSLAEQTAWVAVFAVGAIVAFFVGFRRTNGAPTHDPRWLAVFLSVWFATEFVYFSGTGGMFHTYYLITWAPSLAGLFAVGLWLWRTRTTGWVRPILILAMALSLAVEAVLLCYAFPSVWVTILTVGVVAAVGTALLVWKRPRWFQAGALALLAAPACFCAANLFVHGEGSNPMARWAAPERTLPQPRSDKLEQFLADHPTQAKYPLAVPSSRQFADDLILNHNLPVIPLGGFMGADPVMSLDDFAAKASEGEIGYALVPAPTADQARARFGSRANNAIFEWVRAHGVLIPRDEWRGEALPAETSGPSAARGRFGMQDQDLYELTP
jgi:4-amino-4-deoxy-L-arabinose transferase-like glycosyltransferase